MRWTYLPSKIEVHAQVRIGVGVGAPAREGTSMLKVVHDASASNESAGGSLLDEIVRDGARQMLAAALQAEVAVYIEAFADEVDEAGRRLVVRNGHHGSREVTTAAGAIPVRAPRVNDKRVDPITGQRQRPVRNTRSGRVALIVPARSILADDGTRVPDCNRHRGTRIWTILHCSMPPSGSAISSPKLCATTAH